MATLDQYRERPDRQDLIIPALSYSDEGNFTCVASNPYGEIRHTFRVEVQRYLQDRPRLVETSRNATVMEGMSAEFSCRFSSDLAVMVHWVRPKTPSGRDQDEGEQVRILKWLLHT